MDRTWFLSFFFYNITRDREQVKTFLKMPFLDNFDYLYGINYILRYKDIGTGITLWS
jgi:hypothetical protein